MFLNEWILIRSNDLWFVRVVFERRHRKNVICPDTYLLVCRQNLCWSDEHKRLLDKITDSFELTNTLSALNAALTLIEVEMDSKLEIIEAENYLPVAHLNSDLVVAIQVKLHEDLLNESLIWNALPQLDHLPILLPAVE